MITGTTRVAAVIGEPIRHSLSPAIHNAAFAATGLDWVYIAFEVPAGHAPAAVAGTRALGLAGLSVTTPHKAAVAAAVDELSPSAAVLGAVNCVVNREGQLIGHNTDGEGFVDALGDVGFDPAGRRCIVLGAGGAARAVVAALGRASAREVVVVNRSARPAATAAALAGVVGRVGRPEDVASADLVVNATPLGMAGDETLPIDGSHLRRGQVVADLVYFPLETPFLREAVARGAQPVDGVGMLVHQAAHAFELWTEVKAPVDVMARAARAELAARGSGVRNI